MTFSDIYKLLKNLFITGIILCLTFSCKKDELKPLEKIYPLTPGGYFVEATECDDVSILTIKITADLAGYPQFKDYFKYSIKLYKIIYRTTYKGDTILASGLIVYPIEMKDSMPSMIVGNGLTFSDNDAPTSFQMPDNYTGFEFIASFGYFTLIPDMIGFGASANLTFPIHNYEYSASTMIDLIYAGKEFIKAKGLKVNHINYMAGYSQGGHIIMSTLKKIEEKPVTDIKIAATAVGAGGYNLFNLFNYAVEQNTYSAPSHLIVLFYTYNNLYGWNRPMTDFFQEPYADKIPELLSGKYYRYEIDAELAFSFDSLMNPAFLNNYKAGNEPDVVAAFKANSVDDWAPKSLLNIIHSVNDEQIPIFDSENAFNKMVSNGSTSVIFTPITTEGHLESGVSFVEYAIKWFKSIEH